MNNLLLYPHDSRSMYELPDESVQMCCTSPPYWGLRKYAGIEQVLVWGSLEHFTPSRRNQDRWFLRLLWRAWERGGVSSPDGQTWIGAYGLEPTVSAYVAHSIEFLKEIRRVLRKDGVVFWNIGDSYMTQHPTDGLKTKDLCLIPFRLAIAAQDDGWWIRSIIIWNKSNPMPEPATDRPTESHEYIIMMTRSDKYYWDQEAVKVYELGQQTANGRNIRSVWTFPTQPYKDAHFAVFPEQLPETCIKAATPEVGCCAKCGAPYTRTVERVTKTHEKWFGGKQSQRHSRGQAGNSYTEVIETKTTGWKPTCGCECPDTIPSLVLDPFAGSGTTLAVARKLGRRAVGYELSTEYLGLIENRNRQGVIL